MVSQGDWFQGARTGWDRACSFVAERIGPWRGAGPLGIVAVAALGLIALVVLLPLVTVAVMVGLIAALIVFWIGEFVCLMRRPDESFPGRHDKLVWSILMIVLPPLGAIAYGIYRRQEQLLDEPGKPQSPWSGDEP